MDKKLTTDEIRSLSEYCLENACNLIEEATLLLEHGKYARSFVLSVVALEELGKRHTLWRAVNFGDDIREWRNFWKRFRSHKAKIGFILWDNYQVVLDPGRFEEIDEMVEEGMGLQAAKEAALYVDLGPDGPHLPSKFPKPLAEAALGSAISHLEYHKTTFPTERGLELAQQWGNRRMGESLVEFVKRIFTDPHPALLRMAEEFDERER